MENINWRFGVVGNIVSEHTDENGNTYYGTKAFTPGTKVYINGKYWDYSRTDISVIGRNRFGRIVCETIPINLIYNIRTQRIYKPQILEIMHSLCVMEGREWWDKTAEDRKGTELFVKTMNNRRQQ